MLRKLTLFSLALLLLPMQSNAQNDTFFETFMYVCTKNITDDGFFEKFSQDFKLEPIPNSASNGSDNFKGWLLPVDDEKYILSIDSNKGKNICSMEAAGKRNEKLEKLLEGFFKDEGTFKKVKAPANNEYTSQNLYIGTLKTLGIDNVFAIKNRKDSTVIVVAEK